MLNRKETKRFNSIISSNCVGHHLIHRTWSTYLNCQCSVSWCSGLFSHCNNAVVSWNKSQITRGKAVINCVSTAVTLNTFAGKSSRMLGVTHNVPWCKTSKSWLTLSKQNASCRVITCYFITITSINRNTTCRTWFWCTRTPL